MTRPFSLAFKQKMVEQLTGKDAVSARSLAHETGISQETLSRWLRDAHSLPLMATGTRKPLYLGAALTAACAAISVRPVHKEPDRSSDLSYSTFVSDGVVRASGARLPEGDPIVSSPITSTLIAGAPDAVPSIRRSPSSRRGSWATSSSCRASISSPST